MLKKLLLILLLIKISFPAVSGKQAITDTLSFSSLNTFVTNLGDSVVAWKLNKSRPLTANLVIPKTQKFSIASGVKLDLAGYTLTIKNGGEFGDSCIVGSSGTVVFDTCSILDFHTSWIGSSGVVPVWRGCNRDTSKVTTIKAGTGSIGSLATTIHINDSTNVRTERITGKSYAQGGYNGNLTGVSDSSIGAKRVENGMYTTGSYANPSCITSLAGSKITGSVSSAVTATGANVATNLNGGYVNATTGTFSGNVTAPSATITAMTSTNNVSDSSKSRSAATDNMYIAGSKVKTVAIVNGSYLLMDELYDFILGSGTGFIFGSNSTGLAIYNNKIQDRGGNSQITGFKLADIDSIYNRIIITQIISSAGDLELGAVGDLTVDIGGVTRWYTTGNLNFESTGGEVNIQSDAGDVHIASYNGDVSIGGNNVVLNGTVVVNDSIVGKLKGESDSTIIADTARCLSGGPVSGTTGTFSANVDINARLTVRQFVGAEGSLTSASLTKDLSISPRTFYTANGSYQWTFTNAPIGTVVYVYNPSSSTVTITLNSDNTSKWVAVPQGHVVQLICVSSSSTYWLWSAWQTTKSYLD